MTRGGEAPRLGNCLLAAAVGPRFTATGSRLSTCGSVRAVRGARHRWERRLVAGALAGVVVAALAFAGGAAGAGGPLSWKTAARDPAVSGKSQVTNLSCIRGGFCLAVNLTGQTATWDGTSWHLAPGISRGVALVSGVSCVTSSFCVAIGSSSTVKRTVNYAVTWTGSSWQAPVTLYTDVGEGGEYDLVHGVSCTSTHFCMALGNVGALVWDGAGWRKRSGATGGTDGNGVLSCASSRFCANIHDNLPNYWNGSSWHWSSYKTESLSNAIPRDDAFMSALSCASATFCVAVDTRTTPLIWDGHTWLYSTVSGPPPGLTSVSCTSASFCVATSSTTGLALRWDGALWVPTAPLGLGKLPTVVSCTDSTKRCLAVTDRGATAITTS